jgi:Holliday junction resolvase RusA-like endonuclease
MITFTVLGQPASKANSRRLVIFKNRLRPIKSKRGLDYCDAFIKQCPVLDTLMDGELVAHIHIWYASQRPDLDPSLILDLMQERIYQNDRQVREMHLYHWIDKDNPRAQITIERRQSQPTSQ